MKLRIPSEMFRFLFLFTYVFKFVTSELVNSTLLNSPALAKVSQRLELAKLVSTVQKVRSPSFLKFSVSIIILKV